MAILFSAIILWLSGTWAFVFYQLMVNGRYLFLKDPVVPLEFVVATLLFLFSLVYLIRKGIKE